MSTDTPRIAVLTPYRAEEYTGGTEIFNGHLRRALGPLELFTGSAQAGGGSGRSWARIGLAEPRQARHAVRSFLASHRANPFDLVISNGLYGWPLALRRLRVPLVQVYHFTMAGLARHALPHRGDRLTTGTVSAFFDRLSGVGKTVVAVSHAVMREVERYYGLRGRVIPNAVDTSAFRRVDPQDARRTLGLPAEGPIGLFVGRHEYAKGADIFLEVARRLPEVTFAVVGEGPDAPNVRTLETVPHDKMPLCYSAADFLFLPSRYEGFNLSILEALACDVPLVVSKAAYHLTADPSRAGYVVDGLRPQDFVAGIRELLDASPPAVPRGSIADAYTFEVFRDNWRGLVTTLLEEGAETGGT